MEKPERCPLAPAISFSVVVPLYNKEQTVRRALDSVLNQSFEAFELIVIDDGSTDNSALQLSDIDDTRLRIISTKNGGVSRARNRGIEEARAEWIAFLDADDEWLPDFLSKVHRTIEAIPESEVVYSLSAEMYDGKRLNLARSMYSAPTMIDYLQTVTFDATEEMNSSCVAVRKAAFHKAGRFPEGVKLGEDTDTWLRLAWTSNIAQVPEVLAVIHSEVSGRKGSGLIDYHPIWLDTYSSWRQNALLSPTVIKVMEAYRNKFVLERAIRLSISGQRLKAIRSFITDIHYSTLPDGLLLKTLAYLLFPVSLIHFARRYRPTSSDGVS